MDWAYVVHRADVQGVAGLLWHNLRAAGASDQVPEPYLGALKERYHACVAANTWTLNELRPVLDELHRADIPAVIFKGAALLVQAYENLGVRTMDDVDILLHRHDMSRAARILRDIGFASPPAYPALFQRGPLVIDAHTGVLNESRIQARRRLTEEVNLKIWENATAAYGYLPAHVRIPSRIHHVCTLAAHASKHSFSHLMWFADIHALIASATMPHRWELLGETALELNLQKPVCYALHYLREVMGVPVPAELLERLEVPRMGLVEHRILGRLIDNEPTERLGDILLLYSMRRARDRALLLWETLFPSRDVLSQIFPAHRSGRTPCLYTRRIAQIMKFAIGQLVPAGGRCAPRSMLRDKQGGITTPS